MDLPVIQTTTSELRPDGVAKTVFHGCVDSSLIRRAEEELFRVTEGNPFTIWLVDVADITFTADIRTPASNIVTRFKNQGGQRMVVVITNSPVRMMANAIAFATGMPMDVVDSLALAETRINRLKNH